MSKLFNTSVVKEEALAAPARESRYKRNKASTLWQLQLATFSASVAQGVHFGSPGSGVATFQYKYSVTIAQHKRDKGSTHHKQGNAQAQTSRLCSRHEGSILCRLRFNAEENANSFSNLSRALNPTA